MTSSRGVASSETTAEQREETRLPGRLADSRQQTALFLRVTERVAKWHFELPHRVVRPGGAVRFWIIKIWGSLDVWD